MRPPTPDRDVFGLLRPAVDAHSLGVSTVAQLLQECGFRVAIANAMVCEAAGSPEAPDHAAALARWVRSAGITRLGFSYRLDPFDGVELFRRLCHQLRRRGLTDDVGGPIISICFAGLPEACALVGRLFGEAVATFCGDETPGETLDRLGVPPTLRPSGLSQEIAYDDARLAFGRQLVASGRAAETEAVDRSGYPEYGTARDGLLPRLRYSQRAGLPPLLRAHLGPYLPDRVEAVHLFLEWTRQLASRGLLDVLSIGTSQLTQEAFGEDWDGRPNGGGVPINAPEEYRAIAEAARPMLVRTYAGTKNIPWLARLHEDTLNIAWHALSFWWFCRIDGRGPYSVRDNLAQHLEALRFIADSGKPFEPNVSHHFAFRGADDVTYIVSAVLAARTAKAHGVRHLVLQNMLNTPKGTWGVQDLAKSRAMLALVRELEDASFRVTLQPRAGLDYLSPGTEKAKAQLAAVTALMDDIEPHDPASPPVIHVVSHSEGTRLADPAVVNESLQITRAALAEYRILRARGEVEDMAHSPEVMARTETLLSGARAVLREIHAVVPDPCSAEGLYDVLHAGFLPLPHLWAGREEFARAARARTRIADGGVKLVDAMDQVVSPERWAQETAAAYRAGRLRDSVGAGRAT
jgi:hypothetical protein